MSLFYATMKHKETYANAFIHKAAWTGDRSKELVYARIAGKPTFVKAIAAGLANGNHIQIIDDRKEIIHLYGDENCRVRLFRNDRIGIASYYSIMLFDTNAEKTLIIGEDEEFINTAFTAVIKKKPIIFHEDWPMRKILTNLNLLTKLDSYNVLAYRIFWDTDKINNHLSALVKKKALSF